MSTSDTTGTSAMADLSAAAPAADRPVIPFPSVQWFQKLADRMNENRVRQEQLGYVDCIAGFRVLLPDGSSRTFEITFDEFSATDIRETGAGDASAEFVLEASLATWREMIENIAGGHGRPDLTHTLNYLSHRGTPIRLVSDDPLKSDLYFRYNQSLQEFFHASASFDSRFDPAQAGAAA